MWFGKKNAPFLTGVITTSEGLELEVVTSYKYLGVWLDGTLLLFNPSCQTSPNSDDHPTHARLET
jgi:hypothetical protein